MKKKFRLIILCLFVLVCSFFYLTNDEYKDNYYLSVNSEIINNNELDDDEYNWSYFLEAQDRVDDKVDLVVNDILNGKSNNLSNKEYIIIKNIYDKALDINKRNNDGISELEPYLNRVWGVSNVDELVDVIILIEKELGIDILTNIEVIQDYRDNSKNIIYFYPVTYAFGASSDYMVNDDYMAYKAYIRRACVQLWKAYGYDSNSARQVVSRIFDFYEKVSNNSKLAIELEEIDNYYNIVNESKINILFSNVTDGYLSRRGINEKVYSLVDEEQYQYLNDSLTQDNLELWKEVIITKILSSYASYGSSEYVDIVDNLSGALLGIDENDSNEDKAKDIVKGLFSSEIDTVYVDKYLTANQFKEIEDMFFQIKDVYKIRLKNNSWLSENAKNKALLKLEKMELIIGINDINGYEIAKELDVSDSSLIRDVINIQRLVMEDDLERLDSGEVRTLVSQTQVNAYYQPLDNSVVIPVAFFELVNGADGFYENLGTLGMILAHEVTHAFDGNGSKFDESGNLNDWWNDEDKDNFEMLKHKVADYYSQYEVLDGKYINGQRTVNENIADLGALACIVDIAKAKDATEDEFKTMFLSFAKIWASVESEEYMELLLLQDVHAPNQFRVNAVLASIDEFYHVYGIYPWNDMWINKDDRIMVW